ncbi:hypothetical protein LSAT2_025153 [Lamellibrachia satsuma]|nr:hypothetical protein LSAT2_025153 [Lamellibrachia satsuma]
MPPDLTKTDPPVEMELRTRLIDENNATCLELAHTDHYTLVTSSSRWVPQTQHKCWLPGLTIKASTPNQTDMSFTVRITGHRLVCAESHFNVSMRQQIWPTCAIAGVYRRCKLSGPAQSHTEGLITCVATCVCEGDDCKHVTIHVPRKYEGWKICEINVD